VLSSDDPVRVFQDFAEVDLLSGGRAEIMAGRGSFTESFPLFGYDLDDYDELYAEKLELLLQIRERRTSPGRAACARRSTTPACGRGRCRSRCPCGSPSAARRSRSSAPARSGCR
jgi:alkanesulfonate monooxygenase SsuD/methylene tetrahydromethanopterin reductase-like flavin-dependent oxidoreductase (luciferase family)